MKLLPVAQTCFVCNKPYKAEWGKLDSEKKWHTDFLCWECQNNIR